jgi:hypothetical protein
MNRVRAGLTTELADCQLLPAKGFREPYFPAADAGGLLASSQSFVIACDASTAQSI